MIKEDLPFEAVYGFLRTRTEAFTSKDVQHFLHALGIRVSLHDIPHLLEGNPYILADNGKKYISRAGAFSGAYFSIKPRRFEIDAGILVIGHRCMPFVDPEMLPHELCFKYGKTEIKKKCMEFASDDILDMYRLFGEEYVPQYLALDPGNSGRNFAENDFEIPNRIFLTVCDMMPLYKHFGFSYGDRLSARLTDWDRGEIELIPVKEERAHFFESTAEDEIRRVWYARLDARLHTVIETYGPCASIEDQLACAFFGNTDSLCTPGCGSIEEYLSQSAGIVFAEYGVETRLWKKGEEVFISPLWKDRQPAEAGVAETLFAEIGVPIPEFMLDVYVLDSLFRRDAGVPDIFKRMVPPASVLDEWQIKTFLLHIESRYAILKQSYNRFTDFYRGEVRSCALRLYSQLVKLICELDACGLPAEAFPPHDLVILSQLFAHTGRLAEVLLYQENISEKELSSAAASLEGMNMSFEDIEEMLVSVMENKKKDAFSIVKHS